MTSYTTPTSLQDSVVQELHELRERLVEQYNGDMNAYTQACERRVQSLGIVFKRLPARPTLVPPVRG